MVNETALDLFVELSVDGVTLGVCSVLDWVVGTLDSVVGFTLVATVDGEVDTLDSLVVLSVVAVVVSGTLVETVGIDSLVVLFSVTLGSLVVASVTLACVLVDTLDGVTLDSLLVGAGVGLVASLGVVDGSREAFGVVTRVDGDVALVVLEAVVAGSVTRDSLVIAEVGTLGTVELLGALDTVEGVTLDSLVVSGTRDTVDGATLGPLLDVVTLGSLVDEG